MNIWGWLLAVCCAVTLGSCDDDDDLSASKVPDNVQVAFEAKFPAVNKVEWEKKSGYYVAEFRENGAYADWRVDDIDKYERPGDTFYLIEIEKGGQQDRDLFYAEDGTLLKDAVDTNNDKILPNIKFN